MTHRFSSPAVIIIIMFSEVLMNCLISERWCSGLLEHTVSCGRWLELGSSRQKDGGRTRIKEGFGQQPEDFRLDAVNREKLKVSEQGNSREWVEINLWDCPAMVGKILDK